MSDNLNQLIYAPVVQNYVDMMAEISESPSEFHIFVLTHTISSILGRNFYIRQGTDRIFPNLYSLIVAPSSEYHKTSCANQFRNFLKSIDWTGHWLGRAGSPEGILEALGENGYKGTAYLYYSEFGELLAASRKNFMSDLIEILNDFYDCPDYYKKRLRKEQYEVNDACLTILGASQLDSLTRHIGEGMLLSGFFPRFFLCYTEKLRNPIIWREPENETMNSRVLEDLWNIRNQVETLHAIKDIPGTEEEVEYPVEFKVNDDARERFISWGMRMRRERKTLPNTVSTMMGRLESLVLKICIIIHMAKLQFNEYLIDIDTMNNAIALGEWHCRNYKRLVGNDLKFTAFGKMASKAEQLLMKKKDISVPDLMRALHIKKYEAKDLLDWLIDTGKGQKYEGERGGTRVKVAR